MKILNLIAQFPGQTGSGTYINSIMNEAKRKSHHIGLIGAIQEGLIFNREDLQYLDLIRFNTKEVPFNIVGMSDIMPYESTKYRDLDDNMKRIWEDKFTEALLKGIAEFKPDIILSHHLFLLTALACDLNLDIPIYAFCHGTDIRQFLSLDKYQDRLINSLMGLKGVFSLNHDQRNVINELYGISLDNIHVVGGGYDEGLFYPPDNDSIDDKIKIVYAGKLSYAKGLRPLIQCIEELKNDHNITLLMAGSGSKDEEYEIRELGKMEEVNFLGNLPQKDLADIFRDSDIFVLPSYYEGLPLVVMEALACNLKIVVSNFKGLIDYIGEPLNSSGLIEYVKLPKELVLEGLSSEDELKYKDNLKKALKKSIINHILGYNSFAPYKEAIRNFSWEGVFNKIEKEILF